MRPGTVCLAARQDAQRSLAAVKEMAKTRGEAYLKFAKRYLSQRQGEGPPSPLPLCDIYRVLFAFRFLFGRPFLGRPFFLQIGRSPFRGRPAFSPPPARFEDGVAPFGSLRPIAFAITATSTKGI